MKGFDTLYNLIIEISKGNYSADIMALARDEYPEEVRSLAEAVGMMMVNIEGRQFHLEQLNEQIKANAVKTVFSIANALGTRDEYSQGHGVRVAEYARRLGRKVGLSDMEVETIYQAGVLHDIGKIGFSDLLFSNDEIKPSPDMLAEIRQHTILGANIIAELDFLSPVVEHVRNHHERIDGKGYPNGISGDDISTGTRILSIADVFDAITTNRPYQKSRDKEEAFSILRQISGTSLDGELVEAFILEIETTGLEVSNPPEIMPV